MQRIDPEGALRNAIPKSSGGVVEIHRVRDAVLPVGVLFASRINAPRALIGIHTGCVGNLGSYDGNPKKYSMGLSAVLEGECHEAHHRSRGPSGRRIASQRGGGA